MMCFVAFADFQICTPGALHSSSRPMVLQLYCWDWAKRGSASWLHVASRDFLGSASYFEFILLFGFIATTGSLVATQFPLSKPSLCLDTSKRIDFGCREALPTTPQWTGGQDLGFALPNATVMPGALIFGQLETVPLNQWWIRKRINDTVDGRNPGPVDR